MNVRQFSRLLLALVFALLVFASSFSVRSASAIGKPIGGCPAGFDFLYPVADLPQ